MTASETDTTRDPQERDDSDPPEVGVVEDPDRSLRDESTTQQDPSLDLLFEILKNSRRRFVIKYLQSRGSRTSIAELAEHIAAIENGISVEELSSSQRKRVYVGLYQCHLPKMEDAGVIMYDKDRGYIEATDSLSKFASTIDQSSPDRSERAKRRMSRTALARFAGLVGLIGTLVAIAIPAGGSVNIAVTSGLVLVLLWLGFGEQLDRLRRTVGQHLGRGEE